MDRVDEVGHRLVVIDGAGVEDDVALVTLGAGLVEVELVGSGHSIRRRHDSVIAVAVLAGRGFLVSLRVPLPVDALVVLQLDVAVALGARAVQREQLALVVGGVLEVLRAPVTTGAELLAVNRVPQDLLVHVEIEPFAPFGVRLQLFVLVAAQAVGVVERLVVVLGVDGLLDRGGGDGCAGEKGEHDERECDPWPMRHEPSPPAAPEPCHYGLPRAGSLRRGSAPGRCRSLPSSRARTPGSTSRAAP
jgi:hypothetical protein